MFLFLGRDAPISPRGPVYTAPQALTFRLLYTGCPQGRTSQIRVSFSRRHSGLSLVTRVEIPVPQVFEHWDHEVVWTIHFWPCEEGLYRMRGSIPKTRGTNKRDDSSEAYRHKQIQVLISLKFQTRNAFQYNVSVFTYRGAASGSRLFQLQLIHCFSLTPPPRHRRPAPCPGGRPCRPWGPWHHPRRRPTPHSTAR